ncbi:hypothetical protein CYMTET_47912 [Cymbomonas tetramitiformis]|uniref:Uncharacterized protein n=1 Tax=Cymbomonas tetramitiformis TaxID=36881 RepID=A0AAE0BUP5_9CHLO|nr:hypothetical protein CYMTET_47912 [Cymbomonas tetramitiformis]
MFRVGMAGSDAGTAMLDSTVDTIILIVEMRLTSELPRVTDPLHVIGRCNVTCSIDGGNVTHLFIVQSTVLTLKNLVLQHAYTAASGAVVHALEASAIVMRSVSVLSNVAETNAAAVHADKFCNVTIEDSRFVSNVAAAGTGGALMFLSSNVTISNCSFVQNTAYTYGGAVHATENTALVISDCLFYANSAAGYKEEGGAIFTKTDVSITVTSSVFTGNHARYGGAIMCVSSSILTMEATAFTLNYATVEGGAIFVYDSSSAVLSNLVLNSNLPIESGAGGALYSQDHSVVTVNATVLSNHSAGSGGTVYIHNGVKLVLNASTITDSSALTEGGAIWAGAGCAFELATSEISNSSALGSGGAIYAVSDEISVTLEHSKLRACTAGSFGGAMFMAGSDGRVNITSCTLESNHAVTRGGAIYVAPSDLGDPIHVTLNNSLLQNCDAEGGSAIMSEYEEVIVTVLDSRLIQNRSPMGEGGAIYIIGTKAAVRIGGSHLSQNVCQMCSGAAVNIQGSMQLSNSAFTQNSGLAGAAISASGSSAQIEVTHCLLENNVGYDEGGALLLMHNSFMNVTYAHFHNNSATQGGAGCLHDSSTLQVQDSLASDNWASDRAGVIYAELSVLQMTRVTWVHNFAYNTGGGGFFQRSVVDTTDSNFTLNGALHSGGVFYLEQCKMQLAHVVIIQNWARDGGGALISGLSCEVTMLDSHCTHNLARDVGGAMKVERYARLQLLNTSLENNTAEMGGGAIYLSQISSLAGGDVLLRSNIVGLGDGGALLASNGASLTLHGVTVDSNFAARGGGMAFDPHSIGLIQGGIINANVATDLASGGGGLYVSSTSVRLEDVAFTSNKATAGAGIYVAHQLAVSTTTLLDLIMNTALNQHLVEFTSLLLDISLRNTTNATTFVNDTVFSQLLIHGCNFTSNAASVNGGAILLLAGSAVSAVNCLVANNIALQPGCTTCTGGGLFVERAVTSVSLTNVAIVNNTASYGGGMALLGGNRTNLFCSGLLLEDNFAEVSGSSVFWVHLSTSNKSEGEPPCALCRGFYQGIATNAVTSGIKLEAAGALVGELNASSGSPLLPPPMYHALDFYGNLTPPAGADALDVSVQPMVPQGYNGSVYARGTTREEYRMVNGSYFDDLVVVATPGSVLNLTFLPHSDEFEVAVVLLRLDECQPGELYIASSELCEECPAGSVKFDNSSKPCAECPQSMVCFGGNLYELVNGYWMASDYIKGHCTGAECVFDHIYECGIGEVCTTSDSRRNVDGALHVDYHQLCAEGYADTTVLCGTCSMGYSRTVTGGCQKCGSHWELIVHTFMSVATMIFVVSVAFAIVRLALRNTTSTLEAMNAQERVSMLASIFFSNIQVMAQTTFLFSENVVPKEYATFLQIINLVNFDIFQWIPVRCISYVLGMDTDNVGGFYWGFVLYALLPLCLMVPTAMLAYLTSRTIKPRIQRDNRVTFMSCINIDAPATRSMVTLPTLVQRSRRLVKVLTSPASSLEVAHTTTSSYQALMGIVGFLLVLLHTTVSSMMFSLYQCTQVHEDTRQHWIEKDLAVECFDKRWWWASACSIAILVVYIVGLPALMVVTVSFSQRLLLMQDKGTANIAYYWRSRLSPSGEQSKSSTVRTQLLDVDYSHDEVEPETITYTCVDPINGTDLQLIALVTEEGKIMTLLDDPRVRVLIDVDGDLRAAVGRF